MQVAGEEGDAADIAGAGEAGRPAFQAHGEAAVRRHPGREDGQVGLVRARVLTALGQRGQVVGVPVQTLAAGDDLQPAEEQVEAVGVARPARFRVGVERALDQGYPVT